MRDRKICTQISGWGICLPERIVTNTDLSRRIDTSDAWIKERTGIEQRHIADADIATSDLAAKAGKQALEQAGLVPADIDLVLVATTTPDRTFPSTASYVQRKLGIHNEAPAMDLQAACSGFIYGLACADALLCQGGYMHALVIGADKLTSLVDWEDRATCVLFGDGAGAFVLKRAERTPGHEGIMTHCLHSDGRLTDYLLADGGVSTTGEAGKLRMNGQRIFREAVARSCSVIEETAASVGLAVTDFDWIVPHQANARILQAIARKLAIAPEKVINTIGMHANTSAASIPLSFASACEDGRIKPGDLIMLEALGGGLTWAGLAFRY